VLLCAACQKQDGSLAETARRPRIALVMKSLANEFFGAMAEGAAAHHAQHADAFDLSVDGIRNETDVNGQIALVERIVARHSAGAIVIAPADSKALVPALKRAMDAGIVVVNIDNKLDPDALREAGIQIPFVGPDNRAGAASVAEAAATRLHAGDEVAILEGIPSADNSRQRRLGFEDAVRRARLNLVAVERGDWEMETASVRTGALLGAHPRLKAIFCANDTMALGAVAAVDAANQRGRVLVTGFDDIPAVGPLLQSGAVAATANQHGDQLAVFGIDTALELLQTRQVADRSTPVDVVTEERAPSALAQAFP
jgi:ribose transport system substrate-binding protein